MPKVIHQNVDEIKSQQNKTLVVDTVVDAVSALSTTYVTQADYTNDKNSVLAPATHNHAGVYADVSHDHSVGDLNDTVITTPMNDKEVLQWDSGTQKWVNASVPSGAQALNDLTDVNATGGTAGQVLTLDASNNWVPTTVSSGGSGATNMSQLSDVDLSTAPTNTQILQYNGTHWVPAPVPSGGSGTSNVANLDDLTDVNAATPGNNQVLAWTGSAWEPANPATATAAVLTDAGVTFDNSSGDNEYIYGSAPQLVVNISAPQDGEGLVYQSGQWINGAVAGSGSADLGIAVTTAGGDVDYEFNATTPSGVPSMDTSSLAAGSTMMWNGSSWVDSGLVIETYT